MKRGVSKVASFCSPPNWFDPCPGLILDQMVEEADPTVALELGTYCGYSAIRIARLLKPNARLLTIEFNPEFAAIAKEIIEIAGVNDKVLPLVRGCCKKWGVWK